MKLASSASRMASARCPATLLLLLALPLLALHPSHAHMLSDRFSARRHGRLSDALRKQNQDPSPSEATEAKIRMEGDQNEDRGSGHRNLMDLLPPNQIDASRRDALSRSGDGRVYVVGSPEGKPFVDLPLTPLKRFAGEAPEGSNAYTPDDPVYVTVTTKDVRRQYDISPYLLGVNEYGLGKTEAEIQETVRDAGIRYIRRGGNIDTRYNWEFDTRNTAADWFFENYGMPRGNNMSAIDLFFDLARKSGAEAMVTIPVLGLLPKARDRSCSFSIKKYGEQMRFDPWAVDCGDGRLKNGTYINWNDVTDTAALYGTDHQKKFVESLVAKWGKASNGGIKYYCLDNEPVWWSYVHRDIKKVPSSYNEIIERNIKYASAIRKADPTALIMGPVSGGWSDVFFSITDMRSGWGTKPWKFWANPSDRRRHGDVPHLQWYLQGMKAYEDAFGVKLLDIVDVHGYLAGPAGDDATSAAKQNDRINAVRHLWDPTFKCELPNCDWVDPINAPDNAAYFLVRVQEQINNGYPGLGMAITEYNFGGNNDPSGAVAQAEALGVMGRLGVKIATRFPGHDKKSTVHHAFKMFGNYDSNGAAFGSLGVGTSSRDRYAVSSFAAVDKERDVLTLLLINLTPVQQAAEVWLDDVRPTKPIRRFRYDSANLTSIMQMPLITNLSRPIKLNVTGYSLNLLEVPMS